MDLTKYITKRQATSLLLKGNPGMSMLEDGLSLAKHMLSTTDLEMHPDFLMVAPAAKKKAIGVDEILPVISLGMYPPVQGTYSVALIDGMDKLTIAAQNKLLILIETNPYVFVIGICYGEVLDTIQSRMRVIPYHPYSKAEFIMACNLSEEEGELFYYATGGCLGFFEELASEKDLLGKLKEACSREEKRRDLFSVLHLVKEKDIQAVTENQFLIQCVLRLLQFLFQQQSENAFREKNLEKAGRYNDIATKLLVDEKRSEQPTYSKNDFFATILYCVEH